jgi:hypothetical protein
MMSFAVSGAQPSLEPPLLDPKLGPIFDCLGDLSVLKEPSWASTLTVPDLQARNARILQLIELINRLAQLYRTSYRALMATSSSMTTFTRLCCSVEHRLMSIKMPMEGLAISRDSDAQIHEAARVAALLCTTHCFRKMMSRSAIYTSLQRRLRRRIMAMRDIETVQESSTRLLLWTACMGSTTAGDHDPQWYGPVVRRCMGALGLWEMDEVRACCDDYVWDSSWTLDYHVPAAVS